MNGGTSQRYERGEANTRAWPSSEKNKGSVPSWHTQGQPPWWHGSGAGARVAKTCLHFVDSGGCSQVVQSQSLALRQLELRIV